MKKIAITLLVMSSLLVAKSVVKEESSGWMSLPGWQCAHSPWT